MNNILLNTLKQLAKGLAVQFGNECEIVIHDLNEQNIEHSIVYIENGHISGRQLNDGPSEIVLNAITHHSHHLEDQLAYLTKTDQGRILKSSTIFIKDEEGNPCYILSINYDITQLLAFESWLSVFTTKPTTDTENKEPKRITQDVNDLLDQLIEQSVELVGIPAPLMTKDDKIKAINYLNDAGAFLITRSGDKIAKYFGISKFTLYSYVNINK